MKKILVISPHSDDELFGMGGTLLKLKKRGYDVLNPSLTLRTYHLHLSNVRNYNKISLFGSGSIFKNKIAPLPYMNVKPTK